jgi:hypothetical protein
MEVLIILGVLTAIVATLVMIFIVFIEGPGIAPSNKTDLMINLDNPEVRSLRIDFSWDKPGFYYNDIKVTRIKGILFSYNIKDIGCIPIWSELHYKFREIELELLKEKLDRV